MRMLVPAEALSYIHQHHLCLLFGHLEGAQADFFSHFLCGKPIVDHLGVRVASSEVLNVGSAPLALEVESCCINLVMRIVLNHYVLFVHVLLRFIQGFVESDECFLSLLKLELEFSCLLVHDCILKLS